MNGPLGGLVLIAVGYLIGAIPSGVLAGRLAGDVDLRQHGSRRTGATNTLRTLGLVPAPLPHPASSARLPNRVTNKLTAANVRRIG